MHVEHAHAARAGRAAACNALKLQGGVLRPPRKPDVQRLTAVPPPPPLLLLQWRARWWSACLPAWCCLQCGTPRCCARCRRRASCSWPKTWRSWRRRWASTCCRWSSWAAQPAPCAPSAASCSSTRPSLRAHHCSGSCHGQRCVGGNAVCALHGVLRLRLPARLALLAALRSRQRHPSYPPTPPPRRCCTTSTLGRRPRSSRHTPAAG